VKTVRVTSWTGPVYPGRLITVPGERHVQRVVDYVDGERGSLVAYARARWWHLKAARRAEARDGWQR
jgi:hypothetical protein